MFPKRHVDVVNAVSTWKQISEYEYNLSGPLMNKNGYIMFYSFQKRHWIHSVSNIWNISDMNFSSWYWSDSSFFSIDHITFVYSDTIIECWWEQIDHSIACGVLPFKRYTEPKISSYATKMCTQQIKKWSMSFILEFKRETHFIANYVLSKHCVPQHSHIIKMDTYYRI